MPNIIIQVEFCQEKIVHYFTSLRTIFNADQFSMGTFLFLWGHFYICGDIFTSVGTFLFLWGRFYRSSTCDSQINLLGNLFNNSVTTEIFKICNKKQAYFLNFGKNILDTYIAIFRVKPSCLLAAR